MPSFSDPLALLPPPLPPWFRILREKNLVLREDDHAAIQERLRDSLARNDGSNDHIEAVRKSLFEVFASFVATTVELSLYSVRHFRKDCTGIEIEYLPTLTMLNSNYSFSVCIQPDPESRNGVVAFANVLQTVGLVETRWISQNFSIEIDIADFAAEIKTWEYTDIASYKNAGTFSKHFLLTNISLFTHLIHDAPVWHFIVL